VSAGGWGLCRDAATGQPANVFADPADPDYRTLRAWCEAGRNRLEEIRRFDMPGFRPRIDWVREMKRYGVLPLDLDADAPLDVYAVERRYWESLWHRPETVALAE
jgi:hypothetical protein